MKKTLTVAKFGGSVLDNLSLVLQRIGEIKNTSQVGPVIVVSAPRTGGEQKCSLTDVAIELGESFAEHKPRESDMLFQPYIDNASIFLKEPFKEPFHKEFAQCQLRVNQALSQIHDNRRFVDVNRARLLAYSGEFPMAILLDYMLRSSGFNSVHFDIKDWPIVTDENFENANFLISESAQRTPFLEDLLESGKIPVVGGYIGVTKQELETTFERGGSDRTATDLAILLSGMYHATVDLEKSGVVLSADPLIVKENLEPVWRLSYNETNLAGMFGMKIIDPSAIRDIQETEFNIPILVTNIQDPLRVTHISREVEYEERNPVKIVAGRKNCAILEILKSKRDSLEDYFRYVRRYNEFLELRTYRRNKDERARFLILDASFIRRHHNELLSFDKESQIIPGLGAITLIGDNMGRQPGVAAKTFGAVFDNGMNIEDGDIQQPTSSILMIVKNGHLDKAVEVIHAATRLVESDAV